VTGTYRAGVRHRSGCTVVGSERHYLLVDTTAAGGNAAAAGGRAAEDGVMLPSIVMLAGRRSLGLGCP